MWPYQLMCPGGKGQAAAGVTSSCPSLSHTLGADQLMCPGGKGMGRSRGDILLSRSESYLGRRSADVARSADVSRWKGAGSSRG
jgi:hypothetical protein